MKSPQFQNLLSVCATWMVHYAYLKIVAFEREQELREINLTEVGCKKMPVMEQQPFASHVKARADRYGSKCRWSLQNL